MECSHHSLVFFQRIGYFSTISFIFFLISSSTQVIFKAEGRLTPKSPSFSQTVNEEKMLMRSQIGSRPPRCDRRCSTCEHCEAIQVPTNPQINHGTKNYSATNSFSNIAYSRGDYSSNYKPMSWKCKCGNLIFNP
ncbi:EPIDERMAL PATTERNING FACTOR-like protein 2 [Mercurialis annua]|uniref:EPIDERMAL PATTERNING FACTOR-like protein 2 n=1 Tax=Mercurialis annua TaxID=3986 RepID=UPI00215EE176|nr:EPIDERMAL PATTERNING FACTOR-like protein 2 [Mercurialis annua]